jgi:hypothetical protein
VNEPTSPSTDIVADSMSPSYGCDCIDKSEAALAKHNTELDVTYYFGGRAPTVTLATHLIEKKRGARPMKVIPNYCPFCGNRYVPEGAPESGGAS